MKNFLKKYIALRNPLKTLKMYGYIVKKFRNYNSKEIAIRNEYIWKKTLFKCYLSLPNIEETIRNFYECNLKFLKRGKIQDGAILICPIKNDIYKIKSFLQHYRQLGIRNFIFIDNVSDDGTVEFLLEQEDTIIITAYDSYTSKRRDAWINRVIAYYGYDCWYIIVDSDEFLTYLDCEQHNINELLGIFFKKNILNARALMIDMYGGKDFYQNKLKESIENCNLFDKNGYFCEKSDKTYLIKGGFRKRVFGIDMWITKFPIIYFQTGDLICNAHFNFPYKKNFSSECYLALRHYKFFPSDLIKYKERVVRENFYNNSSEYKIYLKKIDNNEYDFISNATSKFFTSRDLFSIVELNEIKWKENKTCCDLETK